MNQQQLQGTVDIWAGIECTFNRVKDKYMDQLERAGFYVRNDEDLERIAALGVKMLRFPIIWEKHWPNMDTDISWTFTAERLETLQRLNVAPIAGLVHHGSGPAYASFYDGSFEKGLASYAKKVATKFPWIEYYTPVNEPLTTARFCGLYGHWYPHGKSDKEFYQILISECKATVLAMQAIREINPNAKLVQTEDFGKTHATELLKAQEYFENKRRWLSFDLISGRLNKDHHLYDYLFEVGITKDQLQFFQENACPPDILGINHYVTSERYLDENIHEFPPHSWGGNDKYKYADVEAVRVSKPVLAGPYTLLKEVWDRFHLPIAVTEVHLHCTREEQLRWMQEVFDAATKLKSEGADIRAITPWAVLGSFDWSSLLTKPSNHYEPGLFDVRASTPRPTALTKLVQSLSAGKPFDHPVMADKGWWQRACRVEYEIDGFPAPSHCLNASARPVIITGKTGTLGRAFARVCSFRSIHHISVGREDVNITDELSIEQLILKHKPWAIINTAGYVRVDEAEDDAETCFLVNSIVPKLLSRVCKKHGVKFVTFSSDLVFNGLKKNPYIESDLVSPLNIYGQSKAQAEEYVLANDPTALVIRTSAFFGPWDQYNFVVNALQSFKEDREFVATPDVFISPTYVPDLVNTALDLLIDDESGIWNISNKGEVSWALLAKEVAARAGYSSKLFRPIPISEMNFKAQRPSYSVLSSEKGFELPSWEDALERFFRHQEQVVL